MNQEDCQLLDDRQYSGSSPPRNSTEALISIVSPSLALPDYGGMLMCCEYPSCGERRFRGTWRPFLDEYDVVHCSMTL